MLRDFIEQEDVQIIQQIFLPQGLCQDGCLWQFTKDGNYSVKSGYHFAKTGTSGSRSPPPLATQPFLTKAIWGSNTTPKIKHFLWRVASKIIPSKSNLRFRHIQVDPYCARCCDYEESTEHILFTCNYATSVWRIAGYPSTISLDNGTLEDKLKLVFTITSDTSLTDETRLLPLWIMWRLWKSRNDLLFSATDILDVTTLNKARSDVREWIAATQVSEYVSTGDRQMRSTSTGWIPPPVGWVKCNYDASHFSGTRESGMGWVIRNSSGIVLDAAMGKFEGRPTVEESEFSSLIWAMQASWSLGYTNVIFEGDNAVINHSIHDDKFQPRYRFYLNTVLSWYAMFARCKFLHTKRLNNRVADCLAKKSYSLMSQWKMFHYCPRFLEAIVNKDIDQ